MIKLSMNRNRRDAIAVFPLIEYLDDDHNFVDDPEYRKLRDLLRNILKNPGSLILQTARQAEAFAIMCDNRADGAADNMGIGDYDGEWRREFLTYSRMVNAVIIQSKKAGWKVSGGGMSCIQIKESE
jgi:hypothetical protein